MGETAGIYLVCGEDAYLVEQATAKVIDVLRGRSGPDLEVDVVDAKEAGVAGVAEEIASPSLFSINKVTVVKRLKLDGSSKILRVVEQCLASGMAPGQYLVLVPEKADKRLKAVKAIKKQGGLVDVPALQGKGLVDWVVERFKEDGKSAPAAVAEALVDLKGGDDLRAIDSEIAKLVTYVGDRSKVTREDVEHLVGRSRHEWIFGLIEHMVARRVDRALDALSDLLETGESPIGIVLMVSREIRWLIQVHLFLRDSGTAWRADTGFGAFQASVLPEFKAWVDEAGISGKDTFVTHKPYSAYIRFREAAGFELLQLVELLNGLLDANAMLVSTAVKPEVILERYVASLSVQ